MAEISAAAVRALRDRTGLPMMDCKKALTVAEGDEQKAVDWLKERNKGKLEERAGNATGEGRIFVAVADDYSAASLVEIQCESEPVAKSESLSELGNALAGAALASGMDSVDALLAQPALGRHGMTLKDVFEEVGGKIREKIVVARVVKVEGPVSAYVHHNGKTAVLFRAEPTKAGTKPDWDLMRDVAMHIAAMRPMATTTEQLDQAQVAAERERLMAEARATGKPENVLDKIVEGRMKNYYVEQGVLVAQPFAKDDTKSVSQALAEKGLAAKNFVLWMLGGK
ncbi:MAG: translation elongation factor Ts [Planctomycetota bacterium]|nr:translation elongation factor Ts [Planctomycetaceae bacterium]MDQ3329880.1 translation elongation factor Ts [Planctomycetota bacterium]